MFQPISLIEVKAMATKGILLSSHFLVHGVEAIRVDDSTFILTLAYPRGGDSLKLRAASAKDCQDWVREIGNAASICRRVARGLR